MKTHTERRKYERFKLRDKTHVFFGSEPSMAGRVLDISLGGLGFSYIASKRRTAQSISLTLVSIDGGLRYGEIIGRTAFDHQYRKTINGDRRCGIQFERLTEDQKTQIGEFIDQTTAGRA